MDELTGASTASEVSGEFWVPSRRGSASSDVVFVDLEPGEELTRPECLTHESGILMLADGCQLSGEDGARNLSHWDLVYLPAGAPDVVRNAARDVVRLLIVAAEAPRPAGARAQVGRRTDVPSLQLGKELGFDRVHSSLVITTGQTGAQRLLVGFAGFEPDGAHRLHRHRRADELVYVVDGEGCKHLALDDEIPARPGDALRVEAGEWHGFHNAGARDALIVFAYVGAGEPGEEGYELFGK